ncbi:MAG: beta-lactamase family protein [Alphaproteobacteria bacterium]|nr:beta-lactamase family protein [Alphaproteobacteria bacterium]MCW5744065.1 beta-lactamase family protein [Alphaproteobacteria bacterium]
MSPIDTMALEKRVDALFAKYARPGSPGAAVGIMRGGEVVLAKGYGEASVEHRVPITPGTVFRIASVTKQFTVACVLMLAREGKLRLDEPPQKYLPDLPTLPKPVTIDQMMRNNSGWPDFLELLRLGGSNLDRPGRMDELLGAINRNKHLNFEPGSRFLYSNTNFLLLGLIAERVAGKALPDLLKERIFAPLGMTSTALTIEPDTVVPGLATAYLDNNDGSFRRARQGYPVAGEGGMTSTVEDLLIWANHYRHPVLPPTDLWAELADQQPLSGGALNPYCRGLARGTLRGLATISHGGLWPGYRTEFLRLPDADLDVVVIANLASLDPHRLGRAAALAALSGDRRVQPAPSIDLAAVASHAGTYVNEAELTLFGLETKNGEVVLNQGGVPMEMIARGDGWLEADRGAFEFALRLPPTPGEPIEVDLGAGRVLPFRRLDPRSDVPGDIAGTYHCADTDATWRIDGRQILVSGPYVASTAPWPLKGVAGDVVEIEMSYGWVTITQLARLDRDAQGKPSGLTVSTARIKNIKFQRTA